MGGKTNPETGLLDSQQRFADEYLIDFNATAAYKRAGYKASGNAAEVGASKLLVNPKVQAYLAKRKEAVSQRLEVDAATVLQRLVSLTFCDIRGLYDENGALKPIGDLSPEQASMIAGLEVREEFEWVGEGKERRREFAGYTKKVKFVNPLDAAKTLGQHFGLFKTVHEHSGKNGGPIQQEHALLGDVLALVDGSDTGIGPASSRGTR